jgi:hypothetical protein
LFVRFAARARIGSNARVFARAMRYQSRGPLILDDRKTAVFLDRKKVFRDRNHK